MKHLVALGGAIATTAGLLALPESLLPHDDALRGTWLVTPWVVLALAWIGDRVSSRRRWPAWGLFVLAVAAPARHSLAWPGVDALWAAGLFTLLGAHVLSLLPALRRRVDRRPEAWPDIVFWLLPFVAYVAIQPWAIEHRPTDGDEPYYLLLAHSLAEDGDLDLADEYRDGVARAFVHRELQSQPGDPKGPDGEVYSRHNALLPLVIAPAYALAGRQGAAVAMAALAALLAWMVLRLARRIWPTRPSGAFIAWALVAWAPPLLIYAHQIWIEVPAALLVALALDQLLALHRRPSAGKTLWLGLWLVLLVMLKLRLLILGVPLALLAVAPLLRQRHHRRVALTLLGSLGLGLGLVLAANAWRYGNPLKIYSRHEVGLLTSPPADWLRGGLGIFYDGAFGLFAFAPIWLLLWPAIWLLVRRRDAFLPLLVVITGPYLLALAPRLEWYGGWSPPFRYPMAVLPLLALALVPLLDRRTVGTRWLLAVLGAGTAVLTLLWSTMPGWTYNLADGSSHLLHLAGWHLETDIGRLVPSMVRWRPASTWVPLLSLIVIPIALWQPLPRARARARRLAAPLGVVGLLLATAAVPLLANALPTRVVHVEDAWVSKTGGAIDPPAWTPQRPLFRGGWSLPAGHHLRIPVVAGGDAVRLRIIARREGPSRRRMQVAAGDAEPFAVIELPGAPAEPWVEVELEPIDWPADASLVLRMPPTPRRPRGGAVIDRVELEWR